MSFSKNVCMFVNVRIVGESNVHEFQNGGKVINFTIVDNQYNKKDNTDTGHFFKCKMFVPADSKNPQFWIDACQKGKLVSMNATATQESWEKDGKKFSNTVFIVRDLIPHYQPPRNDTGDSQVDNIVNQFDGQVVDDGKVPF